MNVRRLPMLVFALVGAVLTPSAAWPHGERTQEPFLRMRSLLYYDVKWSSDRVKVNEDLIVTGRFRVFDDWPIDVIGKPDVVYLNTGVPGPVFARKGSYLNGVNMVNSTSIEIGGDYEFKMILRGRLPGVYHVHPMVNVYNGGPIVGPGKFVTVEAGETFTNPLTTLTGQALDLEHYGLSNVIFWHAVWLVIALAWLLFWVRRPLFIPRLLLLRSGSEEKLISPTDRMVAAGLFATTFVVVIVSNYWANSTHPITVPLQSSRIRVKPLERPAATIEVDLEKATYQVPGRTVNLELAIRNKGDKSIQLSEFTTASVRFLNASVAEGDPDYPSDLIAPDGLRIEPNEPIAPGETRKVKVSASDPVWETERLALLLYDPDSRFGGLLMFRDADGNRELVTIGGPIIPNFTLAS